MKKPWLSAALNFFFMGAGYIYNGKRMLLGVVLTLAAFGLTYVENFHNFGESDTLQTTDSTAFGILFVCIFTVNTALAVDGFQEAKNING